MIRFEAGDQKSGFWYDEYGTFEIPNRDVKKTTGYKNLELSG